MSQSTSSAFDEIVQGVVTTAAKISEIAEVTADQATTAKALDEAIQMLLKSPKVSPAAEFSLRRAARNWGLKHQVLRKLVGYFQTEEESTFARA